MLLARVVGLVVATPKADELEGVRFALLQPVGADLQERGRPVVAVDTVGAGEGHLVFTAAAGSARAASGMTGRPVDLAVVGIVDEITREGETTHTGEDPGTSRGSRRGRTRKEDA